VNLTPYPLPGAVREGLLHLAAESEYLLLGEGAHGTEEVPRLVACLLEELEALGYGGLALEIPIDHGPALQRYAAGLTEAPPAFFTAPPPDGRGNLAVLALVRLAARSGWQILCCDMGEEQPGVVWRERDAWMARNLMALRQEFCPGRKVLVVAGSLHTRLTDLPAWAEVPFLAGNLSAWQSDPVRSVAIVFHGGTCHNAGIQRIEPELPAPDAPELRPSTRGHTLDLHLPCATAAALF
jgi:erythromycin esterase-like protein